MNIWTHMTFRTFFQGSQIGELFRNRFKRVISGFRCEVLVTEICPLMGYYAASSGNLLLKFWENLSIPSSGFMNSNLTATRRVITQNCSVLFKPDYSFRGFEVIQKTYFVIYFDTRWDITENVVEHKFVFHFSLQCFLKQVFFLAKLFVWHKNGRMWGKVIWIQLPTDIVYVSWIYNVIPMGLLEVDKTSKDDLGFLHS
jgi:hypothetical protein